jgi:hypothetical protein
MPFAQTGFLLLPRQLLKIKAIERLRLSQHSRMNFLDLSDMQIVGGLRLLRLGLAPFSLPCLTVWPVVLCEPRL